MVFSGTGNLLLSTSETITADEWTIEYVPFYVSLSSCLDSLHHFYSDESIQLSLRTMVGHPVAAYAISMDRMVLPRPFLVVLKHTTEKKISLALCCYKVCR